MLWGPMQSECLAVLRRVDASFIAGTANAMFSIPTAMSTAGVATGSSRRSPVDRSMAVDDEHRGGWARSDPVPRCDPRRHRRHRHCGDTRRGCREGHVPFDQHRRLRPYPRAVDRRLRKGRWVITGTSGFPRHRPVTGPCSGAMSRRDTRSTRLSYSVCRISTSSRRAGPSTHRATVHRESPTLPGLHQPSAFRSRRSNCTGYRRRRRCLRRTGRSLSTSSSVSPQ